MLKHREHDILSLVCEEEVKHEIHFDSVSDITSKYLAFIKDGSPDMLLSLNLFLLRQRAWTLTGANEVGSPGERLSSPKYTPIKKEGEK